MNEPITVINQTVVVPSVHDANMFGVVSKNGNVTVSIKNVQEQQFDLIIPHVIRLNMIGFKQGNILLDVLVYNGTSCPLEYVKLAYDDENSTSSFYNKKLEDIEGGSTSLIYFRPSYGAELFVIFQASISDIRWSSLLNHD